MDPEDSAKGAVGYSLRQDPVPNTQIDFGELVYQREISEQRRLASLWNKESKEVAFETQQLQTLLYTNWEHLSARKIVDRLAIIWKSFETVHSKYLPGIRDSKRLQEVQQRFKSLKEQMMFTIEECETQIRTDQETQNVMMNAPLKVTSRTSLRAPLLQDPLRRPGKKGLEPCF